MPRLSALSGSDQQLLLGVLAGLTDEVDADGFAAAAVRGVRSAVQSDVVTLNEVDPAKDRVVFLADPPTFVASPDSTAILAALAHEHPLVRLFNETGDGSAHKISDVWTTEQFHASELYRRVYAPMRIEFQMSITLPAPRPIIVAIALSRADVDFDERDRLMLNTLRPHLAQMWRSVRERDRLAGLLGAAASALVAGENGVVVVGDPPQELTPGALVTIYRFFGRPGPTGLLPPRVDHWLASNRIPGAAGELPSMVRPLVSHLGGRTAILRYLPSRLSQPEVILVRVAVDSSALEHLVALGLTRREAEVLRLVTAGATNAAAARELRIAPGTVKKHLDNVYAKLAVSGRGQAAALVFEVIAHHN